MERKYENLWAYKNQIDEKLAKLYKPIVVNEDNCFLLPNGRVIHVDIFEAHNALVIEYGDNLDAAKKNLMPDGDSFYPDEMSVDEMFEAMLKEMND